MNETIIAVIGLAVGIGIPISTALIYYGKSQGSTTAEIKGIRSDIHGLSETLKQVFTLHTDLKDEMITANAVLVDRISKLSERQTVTEGQIGDIHRRGCDRRCSCNRE